MKIREATQSDADQLVQLGAEFHATSPYAEFPFEDGTLRAYLADWIDGENSAVFVADADGELLGAAGVGCAPLFFSHETYANEYFWYVPETFRGEGIGGQLCDAMTEWAKGKGCAVLLISTFGERPAEDFIPLHQMYTKRLEPCA